MGVLNVTPDSFADGGRYIEPATALAHARAMVAAGADILDVGGESTRPGARAVDLDEEARRVLPVVEQLADVLPVPVSVDTSKPEIMRRACAVGAGMINDVSALTAPGALEAASAAAVPVVLMHMQGSPRTMQQAPLYQDVVSEVATFLRARIDACLRAGIAPERILVDPGFGFGKSLAHNLALLRDLARIADLGCPVVVGLSRKSMLGALLGDAAPAQRVVASAVAAAIAVERGAAIVRVHDVAETRDALAVIGALLEEETAA